MARKAGLRNDVALWSALAAFFGSLLVIGAIDVLDPNDWIQFLGALFVAIITAGAVYAKQQLTDAKRDREEPPPPSTSSRRRAT